MCYAGGQIWGAGLRKSGGNRGESNKTQLPRGLAPNGKRVIRMEPYSFFPKWNEKVKNQARAIAVQYAEAMEPFHCARFGPLGATPGPAGRTYRTYEYVPTDTCMQSGHLYFVLVLADLMSPMRLPFPLIATYHTLITVVRSRMSTNVAGGGVKRAQCLGRTG